MLFFGLSLWAKTGRSPNRNIAQGNTLGVSELSNLRSERAAGVSSLAILPIPFALSERKIAIPFLPRVLPWAVFPLGFQPVFAHNQGSSTVPWTIFLFCFQSVFARNHGCSIIFCALFPLAFCPLLPITMVAAKSSVLYSCWVFSPSLLVIMAAAQCSAL